MKKLLLSFSLVFVVCTTNAQNLTSENFDVFPTTWTKVNMSSPVGTNLWGQAASAQSTYFVGGAYNGTSATSYAFVFFQSVATQGNISNWLITPPIDLQNGDVISFYSRKGLSGGANVYADRMELRLSTNGSFTTDPSTGATDVGDYTTLALTINPNLTTTDYPTSWTLYSYTVSGIETLTSCKIAFRYFVTDGGISGMNSDYIGIDAFSVDRPLATDTFFTQNFKVYPNPATTVVNILSKNNTTINQVQITDLNGRVVKSLNSKEVTTQINIADLNAGVYFLKVATDSGVGTTKIVKN